MTKFSPPVCKLERLTVEFVGASLNMTALHDITADIAAGSWTAIIGDNGSGKSTLAKVLAELCPLTDGQLHRAEGIAVYLVMQNPETQILGDTVYEELLLSMRQPHLTDHLANEEHMLAALREVGLAVLPEARIKQLSGGQKQLLNIACALLAGADVLLFDEATSMLDPGSRQLVLHAAAALHRSGKTIVWVTHRMEELGWADRVLVLEQGRIAFDGDCERFFYGAGPAAGPAPCELAGFEPPYAVQAARSLSRLGYKLPFRPLHPQQFSQAVITLCPSKSTN